MATGGEAGGTDVELQLVGELELDGETAVAVELGGERWSWRDVGQALAETLASGRSVELRLVGWPVDDAEPRAPARRRATPDDEDGADAQEERDMEPSDGDADADAGTDADADAEFDPELVEAVALLEDCLPPAVRPLRPTAELRQAAARIRAAREAGDPAVDLIADACGWTGPPPSDDADLWLAATMCLAARGAGDDLGLDPDDWLAVVIELTRAGAGTPADAESLVALSARCLDVDSRAVDPSGAAHLRHAFSYVFPVWQSVGAVDGEGVLTALGAWGLAPALARAWGGQWEET